MADVKEKTEKSDRPRIDANIPLVWLVGAAGGVAWSLILMYFTLQQLTTDVGELKIAVRSGNSISSAVTGELALMKFRIENLEEKTRQK